MNAILAAVDGSEPSVRAAQRAMAMAPCLGLAVQLAHVIPDKSIYAEWQIGGDEEELHQLRLDENQAFLQKLLGRLAVPPGLAVTLRGLSGTPAEAIAAAALAPEVELVAVGSRGRTLIGGVLVGSVAHRLVHICKKPILIVH